MKRPDDMDELMPDGMPSVTIRNVNIEEDADPIAQIYNHYILNTDVTFETQKVSAEDMRRRIQDISDVYPYLVCAVDGQLAGYAYVHAWNPKAAYSRTVETTIYLCPEHAGHGIGKALLHALEAECRQRGLEALIALITATNESSCAFHEGAGYAKVGHLRRVGYKFDKCLDVAIYEHLLNA